MNVSKKVAANTKLLREISGFKLAIRAMLFVTLFDHNGNGLLGTNRQLRLAKERLPEDIAEEAHSLGLINGSVEDMRKRVKITIFHTERIDRKRRSIEVEITIKLDKREGDAQAHSVNIGFYAEEHPLRTLNMNGVDGLTKEELADVELFVDTLPDPMQRGLLIERLMAEKLAKKTAARKYKARKKLAKPAKVPVTKVTLRRGDKVIGKGRMQWPADAKKEHGGVIREGRKMSVVVGTGVVRQKGKMVGTATVRQKQKPHHAVKPGRKFVTGKQVLEHYQVDGCSDEQVLDPPTTTSGCFSHRTNTLP